MSWEKFDDACKGCEPAMLDLQTGKPLPLDSAPMKAIMGVWKETTKQERQAFHEFTCKNSRAPWVMRFMQEFYEKVQAALKEAEAA
jgi:hypothetical protein